MTKEPDVKDDADKLAYPGNDDGEPDMDPLPEITTRPKKKKGGKVMKAHGDKPKRRLDKKERK